MGRTKKAGTKQDKTKTKRNKKEEDLEDFYSDSETGSETGSDTGSDTSQDEYEGTFDDMKDYDMTMPMFGIGIGLDVYDLRATVILLLLYVSLHEDSRLKGIANRWLYKLSKT